MKRWFRFSIVIAGLCLWMASWAQPAHSAAKWTFMVYISDCDLEAEGVDDFLEMAQVGSNADLNILVQFDRIPGYDSQYGDWTTCKRFRVAQGMTPTPENALADIGEVNTGDGEVLKNFFEWGVSNYPADRYALILWNHGGGWRKTDQADSPSFREVCLDETNQGDSLLTAEVESALNNMSTKPDLIGFDACLMGMAEVAYQIRDTGVKVMVASEESEPLDGWPYDTVLFSLNDNLEWTAAQLGTAIVDRYYRSYPDGQTQSAIDLPKMGDLASSISEFANILRTSWITDQQAVREAAGVTMSRIDSAVIHEKHGENWRGSKGIAIYFPKSADEFNTEYNGRNIAFAADTFWDEFLSDYYQSMSGSYVDFARKLSVQYRGGRNENEHIDLHHFCSNIADPPDTSPGYTVQTSAEPFEDIRQTGTPLHLFDEDYSYIVPADFTFHYYGETYTGVSISDNGVIYFMDQGFNAYLNQEIPGSESWGAVFIAPLWDDFDGAQTYWKVVGSGADKRLIIQWQGVVPFNSTGTNGGTFQAVLYENGKILFKYKDLLFGNSDWDQGASATVGVQGSLSRGLEYSHNKARISSHSALLFTPTSLDGCTYTLSSTQKSFPEEGGTGTVSINTDEGCGWTAASNVGWASVIEGRTGTGTGTVKYTVMENTGLAPRTGSLTVAGQIFTLIQATPCSYEISPAEADFSATGGTGTIQVSSSLSGCIWTAASQAYWINITAGESGQGTGTVEYSVSQNTGSSDRTGTLKVAGNRFTVIQAGSDSPSATWLENNVTVKDISGWLGNKRYYRIQVPAGASDLKVRTWGGTGDGDIFLRYGQLPTQTVYDQKGENPGNQESLIVPSPHAGTWYLMLYAYESFDGLCLNAAYNTVSCEYSFSSESQSFSPSGGTGSFTVNTGASCVWSAATQTSWIQINSMAPRMGTGAVGFEVAPNTAPESRTGAITVSSKTVTITQSAPPPPSVTGLTNGVPVTDLSSAPGESAYFKIQVPADQAELTIKTWGGTGDCDLYVKHGEIRDIGNADEASYSYGNMETVRIENPRSGDWYILLHAYEAYSGLTLNASYTLIPCEYTVSPQEAFVEKAGGTGTISVTAPAGCAWNVSSTLDWLSITSPASGGGTGNGTVTYTVAANSQVAPRIGVVQIADQSVNITQAGTQPIETLENGVPVTGLSGNSEEERYYRIQVPQGQKNLLVDIWNGTGDADLYLRYGALPDTLTYDHKGSLLGNNESIHLKSPGAGKWYILIRGYERFSDLSVKAEYNSLDCGFAISPSSQHFTESGGDSSLSVACLGGCPWTAHSLNPNRIVINSDIHQQGSGAIRYQVTANEAPGIQVGNIRIADQWMTVVQEGTERTTPTVLRDNVPCPDLSADTYETVYYQITVPADQRRLVIQTYGGTGDGDLYVRCGQMPSFWKYDFFSRNWHNDEQIVVDFPRAGDWYILLDAYEAYSGLSIKARYDSATLSDVIAILQVNGGITPSGMGSLMELDYDQDGRVGIADAIAALERVGGSRDRATPDTFLAPKRPYRLKWPGQRERPPKPKPLKHPR